RVLVDAAQSISHVPLDVRDLDCDWLVFSGHKIYGPTGIGVLYGKADLLQEMPPWQGGGDMIHTVSFRGTTYAELPSKFEAGTPNIAGTIGLGAAIEYVQSIGLEAIAEHEDVLLRHATERVRAIRGVRIVGNAANKSAVISFVVTEPAIAPLDVGTRLDLEGVAVRTGHHCCQPLMERLGISGTARMSLGLYNTLAEIDQFADALQQIVEEGGRRSRSLAITLENCPAEASLCGSTRDTCPPRMDVQYAPAMGESPSVVAEDIAEVFDLLEDWGERYQYVIELGEKLPAMPEDLKTECTRVHGCQSTVYLAARKKPGSRDVLEFLADSDAELVRGLVGVLEHLFSGQRAQDVLAFDVDGFFHRLGLDQHLSMNRRNGLAAMVQRLKQHAAALTA
ncbi:MAG: aminotransferase class V-fold PLP-dependent enzyme, partial [Gemmataceae bacterium]